MAISSILIITIRKRKRIIAIYSKMVIMINRICSNLISTFQIIQAEGNLRSLTKRTKWRTMNISTTNSREVL